MFSVLAKRLVLPIAALGLALVIACGGGGDTPAPQPSSDKAITGFTIASVSGTINQTLHTVSIQAPWDSSLAALTPTITVSPKATVNPASGQSRDFSAPVNYTVTAEDKSTQVYVVTATLAPPPAPTITSFSIGTASGVIDTTLHTVSVTVAATADVTAASPTITVSSGATVSPLSGVTQDFTNPVTYTVNGPTGSQAYVVTVTHAPPAISAADLNTMIGTGINLGNTLDATPNEGSWAAVAQESYFEAYQTAGFTSVRIPITWNTHFGASAPYTINSTYLDRVKTVAGWARDRGLAIVINAHHDDWVKDNYAGQIVRLEALWSQIATAFKDWPSTLAFEILNEPKGAITDANVNDMNARILAIIRRTNPTRVVIIGGNSYNSMWKLTDNSLTIPNDPYLIATFHYYNPWSFAGQSSGTWGTAADINQIQTDFVSVKNWGIAHSIPVYMGEYGVILQYNGVTTNAASRLLWYQTICQKAYEQGISSAAWDDSGDFGIFYRSSGTWETAILDAIMRR
jgi:hypothetical protein